MIRAGPSPGTVLAAMGGRCQAAHVNREDLACSRGVLEAPSHPGARAPVRQRAVSGPPMLVLIGLGGLGCPVILSSLTSGVRRMLLVDGDSVSTSNLQRQVLYRGASEGHPKATAARRFSRSMSRFCERIFRCWRVRASCRATTARGCPACR